MGGAAGNSSKNCRRIPAGLAIDTLGSGRRQTGRLADRPKSNRCFFLYWRHWFPCRKPRALHYWFGHGGNLRRHDDVRAGTPIGRRWQCLGGLRRWCARGILYASQVSVGEENNLRIRIYGTDASLDWHQENPNYLYIRFPDGPEHVYKRGNDYVAEITQHNSRLPFGHPEGFIEAFANIYVNATRTMAAKICWRAAE